MRAFRTWFVVWFSFCCCGVAAAESPSDVLRAEWATSLDPVVELESGWRDPPSISRTRCWWWWLNGNVTKEAITRDLEEMKAKGLGGANIIDAGGADQRGHAQVPHGPDFASAEWRELFVHALAEADRRGLELGLNIQSGWNLGGPTVRPEHAAKKLTWAEADVSGGPIDFQLPMPPATDSFYRDIATLAVRMPPDGRARARVRNFEQKAYHQYPGPFTATRADHLLGDVNGEPGESTIARNDIVDVSEYVDKNGRLQWNATGSNWKVLRFGYTLTGSQVSTSSDGWNGYAIDYLDREAFDVYWRDVVQPLLEAARPYVGRSLKFLHTDSWELGPVNWTPSLPTDFAARRGYEIVPFLPVLAGYVVEDRHVSNRFLNDFRRTLAEGIVAGKYEAFREYSHRAGLGIHPESGGPHAAPIDALLCLSRNDIPMGEFWARSPTHRVQDFERFFTKQSASAAHVYGKRLVLAEAFTTIGPQWEEGPRELRPVFDQAACEGLNLVMLHTFDCSPESMGLPGQAYFAGTHINPNVTWWRHAAAFFEYLNRCQFLLQQGLPVADVLYFYGENVPSFVRLKSDDPARVLPGYDYDVINLEALLERTRVRDGKIVLPDGAEYRVLVLPPGNSYGLEALKKIESLASAGATVVGPRPTRPIGLSDRASADQEFQSIVDKLWSDKEGAAAIIRDVPAREALAAASAGPDFEAQGIDKPSGIRIDFIHRRSANADFYFIANRTKEAQSFDASFRISGRQPELWDPVTSEIRDAKAFTQDGGRTIVPLMLTPESSMFVVFRRSIGESQQGSAETNDRPLQGVATINNSWRVEFDSRRGGPTAPVVMDHLVSWTEQNDPKVKYYSGTAVYRTSFQLNENDAVVANRRTWLDLGEVKNVAEVRLNGESLGVAWTAPFRVETTGHLREGTNDLEIEVTNLWPNRLIGDAQLPPEARITKTNITKFNANSPLLPSGLLGPVKILAEPAE